LSKRTVPDFEIATARKSKNANFSLDANSAGPGGNTPSGYNENRLFGHSQAGVFAGIATLSRPRGRICLTSTQAQESLQFAQARFWLRARPVNPAPSATFHP
jgi:hypothetical protein